jgi:MFS family permease
VRRLLALRDARVFLAGQTFSIFGDSALWLAAGIWVKVLTGSNAAAGLTFFFFVLPTLASPLAGMLVDRMRKLPVLIVANAISGAAVLLLLFVHGPSQVWLIWAVMLIYGLLYTVLGSAQSALLTLIVPDELLGDANGALRTVREGLRLVAPLFGAGLFAAFGGGAVAIVDAATFGLSIITLVMLRVHETLPARTEETHWLREFGAGFAHIRQTVVLRQLTIATAAVLLVAGFFETIGFATVSQGLHEPPTFLGVLGALQGAGAIIGGPTAAPLMRKLNEGVLCGIGMLGFALGAALWTIPSIIAVAAGSIIAGASIPWLVVGAYTLVQRRTPPELQGRAFSAFDMAVSTPQTISIAIGAVAIAVVPYQMLLAVMVAVTVAAAVYLLSRPEQRMRAARRDSESRAGTGAASGRPAPN